MKSSKTKTPKLGWAAWRGRLIFRSAFLLLLFATVALTLAMLSEQKQRSHRTYAHNLAKTQAEIIAKLRHPTGQLALINPQRSNQQLIPLSPLLLPYAALDFDDQHKAQQAVEMAGCLIHYPQQGEICVAVGNNPYAGGFIYLVGRFFSETLVARARGVLDLSGVHYARIRLQHNGKNQYWLAPFEHIPEAPTDSTHGQLIGFVDSSNGTATALKQKTNPLRDFRGWLWQNRRCSTASDCQNSVFFSIRLPVEAFSAALFKGQRPAWPPADLNQMRLHLQFFAPQQAEPIFDSNRNGATPPFALSDLLPELQDGEVLSIHALNANQALLALHGEPSTQDRAPAWLLHLIEWLPQTEQAETLTFNDTVHSATGSYQVQLTGNPTTVDSYLASVAKRVAGYVAAMLLAIVLAWVLIEWRFLRRVSQLTRRAAAVSYNVQDYHQHDLQQRLSELDLSDLRGKDELGILASSLADLLQRVKEDMQREQIRAQQERDLWHAVGHEILSPLQSLMVLHPDTADNSFRYIQRMQQAVRILYGSAPPSEALQAISLQLNNVNLVQFLQHIADNAEFAGINKVLFDAPPQEITVLADEFSLEDVLTHILRNADRYRQPNTPIRISVSSQEQIARVCIHNQGSSIAPELLDKIFEYGVSDPSQSNPENRGQGLFVAKTYMAKMGGTIQAHNVADGVAFNLLLHSAR